MPVAAAVTFSASAFSAASSVTATAVTASALVASSAVALVYSLPVESFFQFFLSGFADRYDFS